MRTIDTKTQQFPNYIIKIKLLWNNNKLINITSLYENRKKTQYGNESSNF